jgi:iron complex outermembrane receptor protein
MHELITQVPLDSDLLIFRNLQNVESDGVELEVKGQIPRGIQGIASYSFQETKDRETQKFLNNSPRNLAKLNATQPLLHRTFFASLDAQYRSGMTAFTGGSISPFMILNVSLLGRRIGRRVDLSANLYNVLDKKYYDPPSTGLSELKVQQDGRTFRVKMTWYLGER